MQDLKELKNNEKKLRKTCPTYYSLLIAQNLWQAHYKSC